MSSEKFSLKKLDFSGFKKQEPTTYDNFRLSHSEPIAVFEAGKVGMPVVHAFESNRTGDVRVSEIIEHTKWPQHNFPPREKYEEAPKYTLDTRAKQRSGTQTFELRDEHFAPLEYLEHAKNQRQKPPERRNVPGRSGDVRGELEPLRLKSKQLWLTDQGETIPHSGFEIGKKIWYEGERRHQEGGQKFDLFKMRVSKQSSDVAIDFRGTQYSSGAGGNRRSRHHLFIGVGEDREIRTARTRQGLIDSFRPKKT